MLPGAGASGDPICGAGTVLSGEAILAVHCTYVHRPEGDGFLNQKDCQVPNPRELANLAKLADLPIAPNAGHAL
jgi:hypothetical protein